MRPSRLLGWAGRGVDVVVVLGCAVVAMRSARGMDINFDQLNYHYYYTYLLLNGGIEQVDPEPFTNRYVNPAASLPWALVDSQLSPRATAGVIAGLAGLNLALVRRIAWVSLGAWTSLRAWPRWALSVLAVGLAGTGAMFRMELGTSLSDVIVSLPILAALLLLLYACVADSRRRAWLLVALAGVLGGVAVGVKLTMGTYVVALCAATLLAVVVRRRWGQVLALAVGGLLGTAVSGGWWFWSVWRATGNPMFPYYNAIFDAPGWGDTNLRDARYIPKSLGDALSYPWYMFEGTKRTSDYPVQDLRWIVLIGVVALAVVVSGLVYARARRRRHGVPPSGKSEPDAADVANAGPAGAVSAVRGANAAPAWLPAGVTLTFVLVGGVAWLFQFGIARYGVTTELLSGVVLALALFGILRRPVPTLAVGAGLAVLFAATTRGSVEQVPFEASRYDIDTAPLKAVPEGSLVLSIAAGSANSFLLPELPDGVRKHVIHPWFYGSPMLRDLVTDEVRTAPAVFVIVSGWWQSQPVVPATLRSELGLVIEPRTCRTITSNVSPRQICKATVLTNQEPIT